MGEEQQKLIRIRFSKDQLTVTKISDAKPKPFDRKEGLVKLELTVAQIFHKVLNKARVVDIFKQNEYEVLGDTLYKILMHDDEVKKFFLPEFKSIHRDKQMRCRISLEFDSDTYKLAALPWEYLRIDENKEDNIPSFFIAADTTMQYDIIRTIDDGLPGDPVDYKNQTELNVIAVSVNATDMPVDISAYNDMLGRLYRDFKKDNSLPVDSSDSRFNFIPIDNPVFADFTELLVNEVENIPGPYVLHFFGHAKMQDDQSFIGFMNNNDRIDWIESHRFASIFSSTNNGLSHKPSLIVLQACESGQMDENGKGLAADLARKGIAAVVAMQNEITEATSHSFISKFYRDLVNGDDVAQAVSKGRYYLGCVYNKPQDFDNYNNNSFGTPVLVISTNFPIQLMPKQEGIASENTRQKKKCQKCGRIVPSTTDEIHRLNRCGGRLVLWEGDTDTTNDLNSAKPGSSEDFTSRININASSASINN